MRTANIDRQPTSGFTLVELLLAISILVVLSTLMLPAVHSTRERTDRVQCLENQRQMILAWSLFAGDHQGRLPANGYSPAGGSTTQLRWIQGYLNPRVAPGDLTNERLLTNPEFAELAAYLPRASLYHCPADRPGGTSGREGNVRIRSYAMNAYMGWDGPVQRPLRPGCRIYRNWEDLDRSGPSRLMVFLDVNPASLCWPFFGVTMSGDADAQFFAYPGIQHAGGAQVAFADGHVEHHKWRDQRTLKPGNILFHAHDTPSPGNSDLAWLRSVATVAH